MTALFKLAIGPVLVHEGGFVNNLADPGGATNYGISLRWLQGQKDLDGHLLGDIDHDGVVDYDDIRHMTVAEATQLYELKWWNPYLYGLLASQRFANKVFDTAINMGTIRAFTMFQIALNKFIQAEGGHPLPTSGHFGPLTKAAANDVYASYGDEAFGKAYCFLQATHYAHLVEHNPKFKQFENGWMRRANWY